MKCKNCGKRIKKQELFCNSCGYYNGDSTAVSWDNEADLLAEEKKEEQKSIEKKEEQEEFAYENEDLLEDFIGDDYKAIKNSKFNIWAFLLSWEYFIYRKLFIIGSVGLLLTGLILLFLRSFLIVFLAISMIICGFAFNPIYIIIAKKKIEKIIDNNPDEDRYTLSNLAMEKGGESLVLALVFYAIFIVIIFFALVPFNINKTHNTNFWKENSENQANCISLIKTAYNTIEEEADLGDITEAACKVEKTTEKNFDIYLKTVKDNNTIYSYYKTENKYLRFINNTERYIELEKSNANGTITEADKELYNIIKSIESNYQDIFNQSKKEVQLIAEKENTSERTNYIFSREEIIR